MPKYVMNARLMVEVDLEEGEEAPDLDTVRGVQVVEAWAEALGCLLEGQQFGSFEIQSVAMSVPSQVVKWPG